jgi:hypothetical protein
VRFGYEIIRAATGQIIAEGETGHVVTDREGRVRSMPEEYRVLLSTPAEDDIHSSQLPTRAGRVPDDTAP